MEQNARVTTLTLIFLTNVARIRVNNDIVKRPYTIAVVASNVLFNNNY